MIRVFTMTQLTLFTSRQKLFDCSYRLSPPNLSFEALEHFVVSLEGDFPTTKGLKRNGKKMSVKINAKCYIMTV